MEVVLDQVRRSKRQLNFNLSFKVTYELPSPATVVCRFSLKNLNVDFSTLSARGVLNGIVRDESRTFFVSPADRHR